MTTVPSTIGDPAERHAAADHHAHTMECMEVWGGNQAIDSVVSTPGLDIAVYSLPHRGDAAGGDIHYVSRCASGRVCRLVVADVAGHGSGVDALAVRLRDMMRRYVNYRDQRRFAQKLNEDFGEAATLGKFATAVLATYWAPGDELTVCNAGHPPPLWRRAQTGRWCMLTQQTAGMPPTQSVEPTNLPLGIDAGTMRYDEFTVRLSPGDLVLLYTDSLIEARDPGGRMLGADGLLRFAQAMDVFMAAPSAASATPRGSKAGAGPGDTGAMNLSDFAKRLVSAVAAYAGAEDYDDDATVLVLRHTATDPPKATFRDWLTMVMKIIRERQL